MGEELIFPEQEAQAPPLFFEFSSLTPATYNINPAQKISIFMMSFIFLVIWVGLIAFFGIWYPRGIK